MKHKYSKTYVIVWLMIIVFSTIYAFMSVWKHNSFQTFGWDLAVFDHGIWQWSQFKIPYSSFHDLPWLADHFNPMAAIGVWGLFYDRSRWKQSLLTLILGSSYTLLMLTQIMPFIGGQPYRHSGFGQSGENIQDVIFKILTNPLYLINAFGDSEVKINTILNTFWPWGFLPIFSPATLILVLEQFASRFLDYGKPIRWTLLFAYSLPMATIMAWGSIYGFNNLIQILHKISAKSKFFFGGLVTLMLLFLIISSDLLLHSPINTLLKPQFYNREKWMDDNLQVLKCIPKNASISAQNSLAPHLSERTKIKVFPEGIGFDYIALDLHLGQSENSFHFLGSENTKIVTNDLIEKKYYESICQSGSALVLKRKIDPPYELNYSFKLNIYEK